jgi:RHS repeat-associated protein
VGRVQYDPYGEVLTSTLPVTLTDRLFTGARFDGTIGLYQMGARWYDPALGRWLQADSIVPELGNPQALNRYAYVCNNPVIYTDPSGHCIPGVDCPGDLPEPDWRPSTDPRSMSQEEYIEYLLWAGVYFEREEAETGGTVGLSLSRDNLNFELGTALAKYAAQGGEASWQAAIGGDPFIVYAVAQFGVQGGEDAALALGQAYQNRAAQSIGGRISGAGQNLAGIKVYRVWGRDPNNPDMKRQAGPWGASWTPVDPRTVPNYREAAGLPSGGESGAYNASRFVSVGIINDTSGVRVRQALSVDGKTGGLTEFVMPNPQTQITLIGVYGVNPPY